MAISSRSYHKEARLHVSVLACEAKPGREVKKEVEEAKISTPQFHVGFLGFLL